MILNGEYIDKLTDEELCMIEQLTYLDEMVAEKAGINDSFSKISAKNIDRSIAQILADFNDVAIARLMAYPESICDAAISGVEWAKIITYLKDPSHRISHLVLRDVMENKPYNEENNNTAIGNGYYRAAYFDGEKYVDIGQYREDHPGAAIKEENLVRIPLALTFTDDSGESAIIAYKGTTGPNEWADNVEAAYTLETIPQKEALAYAEDMAKIYGDLTVVGHSKGSNKAMYVAILCDAVKRCVGFDGEGFSKQFLTTYEEKIKERAHLITNYALATDFVHELLYQLPGSRQLYAKGYGVDKVGENHAPMGFFEQEDNFTGVMDKYNNPIYDYMRQHATEIAPLVFEAVNNYGFNSYEEYIADVIANNMADEKICAREIVDNAIGRAIKPGANFGNLINIKGYYKNYQEYLLIKTYEACGDDFMNFMKRYTSFGISQIYEDIPNFNISMEDYTITDLKGLTDYLISVGNKDVELLKYVEGILEKIVLAENVDGKFTGYTTSDILQMFFSDQFTLGTLLGHIMYYSTANDLDLNYVSDLLDSFSFSIDFSWKYVLGAGVVSLASLVPNIVIPVGWSYAMEHIDEIIDISVVKLICKTVFEEVATNSFNDRCIKEINSFFLSPTAMTILKGDNSFSDFLYSSSDSTNNDIISNYISQKYNWKNHNVKNDSLEDKIRYFSEYKKDAIALLAKYGYRLILGSENEDILTYDSRQQIYLNGNNINKVIVLGGDGNDRIYVKGEYTDESLIYGGQGDDYIELDGHSSEVHGDSGAEDKGDHDIIIGSYANDTLYGNGGSDIIIGAEGADHIYGQYGSDDLHGGIGRDRLEGGEGDDYLYGDEDDDELDGGSGNDILSGGSGNDELKGGVGNDTYNFSKYDDHDIVDDKYGNNVINFVDTDKSVCAKIKMQRRGSKSA